MCLTVHGLLTQNRLLTVGSIIVIHLENKTKMRARMKLSPRITPSVKLKTIFVYTAASIALIGVIVWLLFLYLNIGNPENAWAAENYSSAQSGNWTTNSSWNGGNATAASNFSDNAIINSNHTITHTGTLDIGNGASITINSNGKLVINGDLIVQNNLTLIIIGELVGNGNIVIKNGGNITVSGSGKLIATGDITLQNNANFHVDGTVSAGNNITFGNNTSFSGNGQVIAVGSACDNWSGPGECSQYQPLPVELLSFTLENTNEGVTIKWRTATEINNDFFTIEQSVNGMTYRAIGTVKGNGTVSTVSYYEYTDTNPTAGRSYYRLVQTDYDGKTETFKPEAIDVVLNKSAGFTIYPNPVRGNRLNVDFPTPGEGTIEILNSRGYRVQTEVVDGFSKNLQLTLHENLEPGLYYINYRTSSSFTTVKLIKQ